MLLEHGELDTRDTDIAGFIRKLAVEYGTADEYATIGLEIRAALFWWGRDRGRELQGEPRTFLLGLQFVEEQEMLEQYGDVTTTAVDQWRAATAAALAEAGRLQVKIFYGRSKCFMGFDGVVFFHNLRAPQLRGNLQRMLTLGSYRRR